MAEMKMKRMADNVVTLNRGARKATKGAHMVRYLEENWWVIAPFDITIRITAARQKSSTDVTDLRR